MDYQTARFVGDIGERRVSDALASEAPALGYRLLNNLLLLDDQTTAQIDHLIVDRFGILVVETKSYHALIRGKSTDKRWTACYPGSAKKREQFLNPLLQNDRHREMVHRILGAHGLRYPAEYVQSLVVFAGGNLKALAVDDVDSMRVIPDSEIVDYLRARCGDFPPNPGALDAEQVANILSLFNSVNHAGNPEVEALHAENVLRATRRFGGRSRGAKRGSGSPAPRIPTASRQIFNSTDRYPDGSQFRSRSRRPARLSSFVSGLLVVALGMWILYGGGVSLVSGLASLWLHPSAVSLAPQAPAPEALPITDPTQPVSYDVPLALQRIREASPGIFARLANPTRPELSTTRGLPTYTWQYLDKPAGNAVTAHTIAITLGPDGQIAGVTGSQ